MERLVIRKDRMTPKYQALADRIFIAEGGYGMLADHKGDHIFGHLETEDRQIEILGREIDAEETNALQAQEVMS
jgi:hypothetical protein